MLTSFLPLLFLSLLPSCTPLRFVGHCTYDGTSFAGWQIQPLIGTKRPSLRPTIQGSLTTAITNRFNLPDGFYIIGAGRTDAGVHAFNQTFHFDLPDLNGITLATHCHCLNRMLPPPIRILSLQPAPTPDFHSITDSRGKHYSYRFSTAATQSPFSRHTETHIYYPISIPLLCQALAMFVGTNDFRAFAGQILRKEKATGEAVSTVRTVYSIDLTHTGNDCYVIDVRLKGALCKFERSRACVNRTLGASASHVQGERIVCSERAVQNDRLLGLLTARFSLVAFCPRHRALTRAARNDRLNVSKLP